MRDICRRNPWGLRRLLESHVGETGIVAYGWFKRLIYWPEVRGWAVVTINLDGHQRAMLDEVKRGPVWIGLAPGRHTIDFDGLNGRLHSDVVDIAAGQQALVAFRPPIWVPLRRPGQARWCKRPLPGEPVEPWSSRVL